MRMRRYTPVVALSTLFVGCSSKSSTPRPSASTPASPVGVAAPATLPPVLPTPEPVAEGVSEVRTIAGMPPAQVIATLAGRKGSGTTSELDCGTGPSAQLQCVDLVVSRLPKSASMPQVQVWAKRRAGERFLGPCEPMGEAVDCSSVLGKPGGAIRMVGLKYRLEIKPDGFQVRWRAMNLAPDDHDVKLVIYFEAAKR